MLLSLDINIKAMLTHGPNPRDKMILENHKQADIRTKNYTERNRDLDAKLQKVQQGIDRIRQKIDDNSNYFSKLLFKLRQELDALAEECTVVRDKYNNIAVEMTHNIEEERKRITDQHQNNVEKKLDVLFSSQNAIEYHNQAMIDATRAFENAKKNYENQYRFKMRDAKREQDNDVVSLAIQFRQYWENSKIRISQFMEDAERYCKDKKNYKRKLKEEIEHVLVVIRAQAEVIRKADDGEYTEGIKSLFIKKGDKPWSEYQTAGDDYLRKTMSSFTLGRPVTSQTLKLAPINDAYSMHRYSSSRKF